VKAAIASSLAHSIRSLLTPPKSFNYSVSSSSSSSSSATANHLRAHWMNLQMRWAYLYDVIEDLSFFHYQFSDAETKWLWIKVWDPQICCPNHLLTCLTLFLTFGALQHQWSLLFAL
jgi:hypothetical protein